MKIIIAGAYAIGTYLAQFLSRNKYDIILIDEQEENLNKIGQNYDLLTLQGKPTSIKVLQEAGVKHADLFIAVDPKETINITACTMAHHLGAKKTVAKIDNPEYMEPKNQELFKQLGIDSLIYPELLAAKDIINGLKMSWVRQRWDVQDGALVMLGIKLRKTCEILDKPLRDISGPDDPYHVVAIKRKNETIIPGGNETLQQEDLAYFMTTKEYIPYIRKLTGKEHYVDVKNVMIMGGGRTAVRSVKIMPEYMNVKVIERSIDRCEYLNEMFDESQLVINGDGRCTYAECRDEHTCMPGCKEPGCQEDHCGGRELRLCRHGSQPGHRHHHQQEGDCRKLYLPDAARRQCRQRALPYVCRCRRCRIHSRARFEDNAEAHQGHEPAKRNDHRRTGTAWRGHARFGQYAD